MLRSISRRNFLATGTFAAAAGYMHPPRSIAASRTRPDLAVGVNSLGSKLDPADTALATELRISCSIFDTLIARDFRKEKENPAAGVCFAPALAVSWTRIDDRTLELNLRRGVKFHNGDEFTADDVAFTFSPERIFGPNAMLPTARTYFGPLAPIKIIDKYTVRISSTNPDPALEARLAMYAAGIVNRRSYQALGVKRFGRAPVGTGPMKFIEWRDGDHIAFQAHDTYFGGTPTFKTIVFHEIPEESTRVVGLISGEFDLITQVSPDQFSEIRNEKTLDIRGALLPQFQMLFVEATDPAVSDKRVRRALSLAINRAALASALFDGVTVPEGNFSLPILGPLFSPDAAAATYDPAAARALLSAAGYSGAPVNLMVVANYYINGEAVAQAIQAMWQSVGVNARLRIVSDWTPAYAPGCSAVLGAAGFDFIAPEALSDPFFGPESYVRRLGFPQGVPELDAAFQALATMNVDSRRKAFHDIIAILDDQVPAIPLYLVPQSFSIRRAISWSPNPDFGMDFRPDNLSF